MHDFGRGVGHEWRAMQQPASKDPLHAAHFGWDGLGEIIPVRCFLFDPSVKSALKFLRKTPWARKKVEDLFVVTFHPEA